MDEVEVGDSTIRLGQLLKLANLVETGGAVKAVLDAGEVSVNGEVEVRRGAQLRAGDVVTCGGQQVRIV